MPLTTIYTDGGCWPNPGPGGYAAVLVGTDSPDVVELSGGRALTTNNRMELLAAIEGLKRTPPGAAVSLHSDSQYVVNGITKGWARKWRANGWTRWNATRWEAVKNPDLWAELLALVEARDVKFWWVRGHAGDAHNERCDALAAAAYRQPGLPPDHGYGGR